MSNGHEPATKADLAEVRTELIQEITTLRSDLSQEIAMLRSEMGHTADDVKETMRDLQTEMLKAFYSFAESNQNRVAEVERDSAGIKNRLATLEQRMLEVEKRLNMPPAA